MIGSLSIVEEYPWCFWIHTVKTLITFAVLSVITKSSAEPWRNWSLPGSCPMVVSSFWPVIPNSIHILRSSEDLMHTWMRITSKIWCIKISRYFLREPIFWDRPLKNQVRLIFFLWVLTFLKILRSVSERVFLITLSRKILMLRVITVFASWQTILSMVRSLNPK